VPGFRANAVDTTGAGDSFFGGFLYRFLASGKALKEVTVDDAADYARFGNATASLCVERRGGIPAMPKLAEVLERLKQ
jgi:fructokinase